MTSCTHVGRFAAALSENLPAASSASRGQGETVGDLLKAVREAEAKIHVALDPKIKAPVIFMFLSQTVNA